MLTATATNAMELRNSKAATFSIKMFSRTQSRHRKTAVFIPTSRLCHRGSCRAGHKMETIIKQNTKIRLPTLILQLPCRTVLSVCIQ